MSYRARLLGPVGFHHDGVEATPRGVRPRTLLAALLLTPNEPVPVEQLAADVWGRDLPDRARQQLHTHVSRLRVLLRSLGGPGQAPALVALPGGYRIEIDEQRVDTCLFTDLVDAARRSADAGRDQESRDGLVRALALWQGPALAGVPAHGRLGEAQHAFEQARIDAVALHLDLESRLGGRTTSLPELSRTATHRDEHTRHRLSISLGHPEPGPGVRSAPEVPALLRPPGAAAPPVLRFLDGVPQAFDGDVRLPLGSPQQTAVLVILAYYRGRMVPIDALVDDLWGDRPPPQATAMLRGYIARLGTALAGMRPGSGPSATVRRFRSAYRLDVPDDHVDAWRLADRLAEATAAHAAGAHREVLTAVKAAPASWNGDPLLGIPGPLAAHWRRQLVEQHADLAELGFGALVELGRPAEALAGLRELVAAHPLRERPRSLLMLALHRSGQRTEALRVFQSTRRLLATELGIGPGPELVALHHRFLAEGMPPFRTAEAITPPAELPAVPQLPAPPADFVGREDLLRRLTAALRAGRTDGPTVLALHGLPGIGKSALALTVANRLRELFPDGMLRIPLYRWGEEDGPTEAAAHLLRQLGTPPDRIPPHLDARTAMLRSALAGRRILLLLDDAHDAERLWSLVPSEPGCAVLVTSRFRLPHLSAAEHVAVGPLSPVESLELLAGSVGEGRVDAEREAAVELVETCGGLPLALRLLGTWLVRHPELPLAEVVRRFARAGADRLPGDALAAAFDTSYRRLPPDQAEAFRLLALVEESPITLAAAATRLRRPEAETIELTEALVDVGLLVSPAPRRYAYPHDLLRRYARGLATGRRPSS
ncbi:BTAD domain-containing putative transcriptional regulator [Kitasatospora sp. NPDC058048]|uniref:AfsR/SARP family transcriptional regulator n=1 Tax=Kitasatospora sp. NPDC058048 TaxID=3346313 RepID=UPI0036DBCD5E